MSNQLNDFGLKIFLDRYALKDTKKDTLAPGDTVVVCVNQKTRQREVGSVEELVDNPGNKPKVKIKLLDGSTVTQDWDDVDKPLETWPEQTMDRVAGGIAAMETDDKRAEWKEKFKWLLDDWRFVPGGRILNAAGTEQALTYFNCLARETLVHLDTGIVEIGTLTGTHNVLSAGGVFRPAEFKSYGVQRLWRVEFDDGEVVHATAEHEWVVLQTGTFEGNAWENFSVTAPRVHTRDLAGRRIPRVHSPQSAVVVSVSGTDRVEEVFCCVEMETHTITIGSDLLTGQCYVIPSPKDSRKGIVETLTNMMEIMSRGGGVGINISSLRPQHAYVKGVNGRSSGSVSWGGLYSFVTGLIEQGGCFAPYTRILTDKGNIPVLEIVERMDKGEKFQAWTHVGWRKITDKFRNGRKSVYRLTTELGYTLDITSEHKVMTVTDTGKFELVKLDKLSAGDSVMILRGSVPNDIPYVALNANVPKDVQGQDVRLPEELDEDLAYVLGYYVGNGCIPKYHGDQRGRVSFAVPDNRPGTLEKLTQALDTVFGRPVCSYQGCGAVQNINVFSNQLVRYFNENGFTKEDGSLTACAPEQIFRSRRSVIEAFIGGWFAADGCNRGAKGGFGIDTISYQGAMDLQKLLQMLGIVSRIATQTREAEGWSTIYRVIVSGSYMCSEMAKWLGDYTDKVADLPLPVKNHAYTWPVNFNKIYRPSFAPKFDRIMPPWNGTTSQAAIAHVRDNIELLTEEQATHFQMLDNCVHDTIAGIEKIGVMDTYDLTVDEVHTMSGDGVYVSNSRRGALMLMLDAWHPDLFKFIDAKREAGRITNANISIAIPDTFMEAVKNDGNWQLMFPDTSHAAYNTEWNGDLRAWLDKDYPVIVHETVKAKDVWDKIVASAWASAEPGLLFSDRVNAMSNSHYFSRLICTNPCLTGDTKVALADGRGTATIKELADAGEDVDVYAVDDKGRLAVRRMRNPRLTGYKQQIYKVTIEGGHTFRTTANHKMILRDGTAKEVRKLRRGDSLWIGHRGVSTYDEAKFGLEPKTDYKYNFVKSCVTSTWLPEHRFFKQEELGYPIPAGYHVHHKNHSPLDNRLENLEVVPSREHIENHMLGENNPMVRLADDQKWRSRYSANMSKATAGEANGRYRKEVSDTELLDCIGELARQLGRQPTKAEWFAYGRENLGLHNITSFRLERLGCKTTSVNELLRLGAERAGVAVTNLKSAVRHEENEAVALAQGYRTHIIEGKLHVERTCEVCGSMFIMPYARREVSSCSVECGKQLAVTRASVSFQAQSESKLDNMLKQYKDLEQALGRTPMKKEYEAHMWEQGFPCRFGGGKGLPAGYKDLQEQAAVYNHKVVKVELDGFEDVYNGTVDEFHNFCIVVGNEHVKQLGGPAELMTGSVNCGEQPLPEWGICNLGAINLSKHVTGTNVDWDTLKQTVHYAVRFLDNVIDATPYFIDENKVQQQRERRVGLGIMGLAEMMIRCEVRYGSKEGNAFIGELGKFIASEAYLASAEYAAEKGSFPEFDADKLLQSGYMLGMSKNVRKAVKEKGLRNVTLLTVAPTGTTGTMVDTSTGIEPYFSWTYWRKSRLGMNEIEVEIVADYKAKHPETKELPPWFVTAMELTPEEHVRAQAALQRWVDSAISKTCNAPNEYTIDQTRDLYQLLYDLGCKGGTIYRDGSRDEQVLMLKKEDAAPAATPAPVKVEVPKPRKRSSPIMTSLSARQMTALGSCYVNTTYDNQFEPLEVFVTSGKAGSDVASLAEALGRVISVNLRLPSPTSPTERLAELAEQLNGIGGSDSVGFGRNKIKSLPDAVGKALEGICKQLQALQHPGEPAVAPAPEPEPEPAPAPKKTSRKAPAADLCPSCGQATYIREEGCRKCTSCGHSACG